MIDINPVELLGYAGSLMLAFCSVPQAILCYKTKSAQGLSWGLLSMWYAGEVFTLAYIIMRLDFNLPLTINYVCNIVILTVIIRYKLLEMK